MIKLDFHFKTSEFSRCDTIMRKTGIRESLKTIPDAKIIGQTDDCLFVIITLNKEFYLYPINGVIDTLLTQLTKEEFIQKYYKKVLNKKNSVKKINQKFQTAQINLTKIEDVLVDEKMFQPFNSNTPFGAFISRKGGMQRGKHQVYMGGAGGGKTTMLMYELAKIQECNPDLKVAFVSAEMDEIELCEYAHELPILKTLNTLCLPKYKAMRDSNGHSIKWDYWKLFQDFLNQSWDLVLIDSIATLSGFIKKQQEWTGSKFVDEYINLLDMHRNGANSEKKFSSFWSIQQVTKGGDFVGGNELKHDTQGMFEIFKEEKTGRRFIYSAKNRLGSVHNIDKMYFSIKDKELVFDTEQLKMDIESREIQNTISLNSQQNQIDLSELLIQHEPLNLDELMRDDEDTNEEDTND